MLVVFTKFLKNELQKFLEKNHSYVPLLFLNGCNNNLWLLKNFLLKFQTLWHSEYFFYQYLLEKRIKLIIPCKYYNIHFWLVFYYD